MNDATGARSAAPCARTALQPSQNYCDEMRDADGEHTGSLFDVNIHTRHHSAVTTAQGKTCLGLYFVWYGRIDWAPTVQ